MAFRRAQESEALGAVMMIYFTFNFNVKLDSELLMVGKVIASLLCALQIKFKVQPEI